MEIKTGKQKTWDDIWKNYNGLNVFGKKLKKEEFKIIKRLLSEINLPKDAKILEIGCGTGANLFFFRKMGYKNSIGIDIYKSAINLCNKLYGFKEGKDVFVMDANNIKFRDQSFDLVFSGGLLEHFKDCTNIVETHCSVSKSRVLVMQPNHESFLGILKRIKQKVRLATWENEYLYKYKDYLKIFAKFNFELEKKDTINYNELILLLFKRKK